MAHGEGYCLNEIQSEMHTYTPTVLQEWVVEADGPKLGSMKSNVHLAALANFRTCSLVSLQGSLFTTYIHAQRHNGVFHAEKKSRRKSFGVHQTRSIECDKTALQSKKLDMSEVWIPAKRCFNRDTCIPKHNERARREYPIEHVTIMIISGLGFDAT
eukprot:6486118-Amphidinium_carterae.3